MIPETFPLSQTAPPEHGVDFERERGVTHVSVRPGVARFSVYCDSPRGSMADIFELLATEKVNLFLIKIHSHCLAFTVDAEDVATVQALCEREGMRYALARHCALISVVAPAMRDLSGVLWRIIGSLRDLEVEILELADAYNSVSCLVEEHQRDRAAQGLAESFGVEVASEPGPMDPW